MTIEHATTAGSTQQAPLSRRTIVRTAAWATPMAVAAVAAPAFAASRVLPCSVADWASVSTLFPGASDVIRDKDMDYIVVDGVSKEMGDVALDGWTSTTTTGERTFNFRVVVGSRVPLERVRVVIDLLSEGVTLPATTPTPTSPGGGATPADIKYPLTDFGVLTRVTDTRYEWTFDTISAFTSGGFTFSGPIPAGLDQVVANISLTGYNNDGECQMPQQS